MVLLQGNLKADPTDRSGIGGCIGMARTGTFGVFGDANCGVSTIGERAEIEFEAMAVLDGALLAAAHGLSTTLVSDGGWPGLNSRRRYVTATQQPREMGCRALFKYLTRHGIARWQEAAAARGTGQFD